MRTTFIVAARSGYTIVDDETNTSIHLFNRDTRLHRAVGLKFLPAEMLHDSARSVIVCETATFSVDESWLSRQPVKKRAGSQLYLSEKVAAQENNFSTSTEIQHYDTAVGIVHPR
jgi:hypothetical protein